MCCTRLSGVLPLLLVWLVGVVASGADYGDRCRTEVYDRRQGCLGVGFIYIGGNVVWGCVRHEYVQMDCDEIKDPVQGADPCGQDAARIPIYETQDYQKQVGSMGPTSIYAWSATTDLRAISGPSLAFRSESLPRRGF